MLNLLAWVCLFLYVDYRCFKVLPHAFQVRWYYRYPPGGGIAGYIAWWRTVRRWRREVLMRVLPTFRAAGVTDEWLRSRGIPRRWLK